VLRHENAVLQLSGPARYEPTDRLWFAALSSLIHRQRWAQVFSVTPGTLLSWHRRHRAEHTYGVFLPKHRVGNPGGYTEYFQQHPDGTYRLIK
jgi:hypothetical protein